MPDDLLGVGEAIGFVLGASAMAIVGRALALRWALLIGTVLLLLFGVGVGSLIAALVALPIFALAALVGHLLTPSPADPPRSDDPESWSNPDGLTPRETEVLGLVADGHSNQEIGELLHISLATVKTHINHIFAKTGVRDRAQAVVYSYRHGLTQPTG